MDTLGGRLRAVHAKVLNPATGRSYTLTAVATWITHQEHLRVSAAYLSQLYRGTREHPSFELLQGLAHFYQVPLQYFALDDANIQEETWRRLDIRALAVNPLFQRLLAQSRSAAEKTAFLNALLEAGERFASPTQRPRD